VQTDSEHAGRQGEPLLHFVNHEVDEWLEWSNQRDQPSAMSGISTARRQNLGQRAGTQSIERAVDILKAVCQRPSFGWQLADLAAFCDLDKSTTHRMLACLARERMVSRGPDGHYMPGPVLFELSLALPRVRQFHDLAASRLTRLAKRTGTVATLYLRSHSETVCALSVGEAATKNFIALSDRMPLITTAGGLAILLALPLREAHSIMRMNLQAVEHLGPERVKRFKAMYRSSKANGFGVHESHKFPGNVGYALAVLDASNSPFAAVLLSGSVSEIPAERVPDLIVTLREEVEYLSSKAPDKVS
jgi:DNA-binding IclR family transcriptional regulator